MLIIVIEIVICVVVGIGLLVALIVYNRIHRNEFSDDESKEIEFLPSSVNDQELLVQNVLFAYYEQQRNELIVRQKVVANDSKLDMTLIPNNDSGYTSVPSSVHTPHSLYECTGFASMDNLEVTNPLFISDGLSENGQVLITSPVTKK